MRARTKLCLRVMAIAAPVVVICLIALIFRPDMTWINVPYALSALAFLGAPLYGIFLPAAFRFLLKKTAPENQARARKTPLIRFLADLDDA